MSISVVLTLEVRFDGACAPAGQIDPDVCRRVIDRAFAQTRRAPVGGLRVSQGNLTG